MTVPPRCGFTPCACALRDVLAVVPYADILAEFSRDARVARNTCAAIDGLLFGRRGSLPTFAAAIRSAAA
jgi:hypothetical protein